jgi:hypothetical protein
VGAFVLLTNPISTRARQSGGDLRFRAVNSSLYSGEFTDERGFYFILEPPLPAPPEPDMDAIRAGVAQTACAEESRSPESAVTRFGQSMTIDYEKWHDGIGYDLAALRAAGEGERAGIELILLSRGVRDWRDVEALAALDSARARVALTHALDHPDAAVRSAVARYAPALVADDRRTASIVQSLESAEFFGGLGDALDDAAQFHPPEVVDALFRAALARKGDVAVHCAALLAYLHGKAKEPFDMEQRPWFLRFRTEDRDARRTAFRELCAIIGVDASKYMGAP